MAYTTTFVVMRRPKLWHCKAFRSLYSLLSNPNPTTSVVFVTEIIDIKTPSAVILKIVAFLNNGFYTLTITLTKREHRNTISVISSRSIISFCIHLN
jgi:hypothetical protein